MIAWTVSIVFSGSAMVEGKVFGRQKSSPFRIRWPSQTFGICRRQNLEWTLGQIQWTFGWLQTGWSPLSIVVGD